MYEQAIYQLYNVTMTSAPIMWFTCFDFEKKRKRKVLPEKMQFDWGDLPEVPKSLPKDKKPKDKK